MYSPNYILRRNWIKVAAACPPLKMSGPAEALWVTDAEAQTRGIRSSITFRENTSRSPPSDAGPGF